MSTTPGALNKAIFARLRGTEVLTGDALAAQQTLASVVSRWRFGTMAKEGTFPVGELYSDASADAMPNAPDVGIITHSIRRFTVWTKETASSFFADCEDCLERLFDQRRGAPALDIPGDGKCYECALFTQMQAPYEDDNINAWWGTIAFRFVEARP